MAQGILILGLNGCGKTTVGRLLAQRLGCLHMDAEDYYFPTPGDYAHGRTEEEVHRLMAADAERSASFVLSCVRCNLPDAILGHIRLAVVLRARPEVRAARIREREILRFGSRVLSGGSMYESQQAFRAFAASRTEALVDQSLSRLACPVEEICAELAPEEIVETICMKAADAG